MLPSLQHAPRPRPALLDLADRLSGVSAILVTAPAGSGKSTLLAAWRDRWAERGEPCATLDLDPLHGDAALLLADLLAAIRVCLPAFGVETERALAQRPGGEDDWRLLARAFLRDREREPHLLAILLDNFHELDAGSPGARLVDAWLRAEAPNLHWVIASRGALPDAVARLRASGNALDLPAEQLALRCEEVGHVLEERGVAGAPELAAEVWTRTGGWATGVQLAARRLASLDDAARTAYLAQLEREPDRFEFIAGEVMRDEPEPLCHVAEVVALVRRCTPGDLVEITGDPEAPRWVERAIARGVLSSDAGTVGIHPLWREFLLARARERHSLEEHRDLLLRAARVLRRSGRDDAACEALAEAGDFPALAELLSQVATRWLDTGRGDRLLEWLGRLPAERVEASAELLAAQGLALVRRAPQAALPLLERAAKLYRQRGDRERERRLVGMVGLLHMTELNRDDALRALRRALSLRGLVKDSAERGVLLVLLAGRRLLLGRFAGSLALSERAAAFPLEPALEYLNAMNLALLRGVRGEWQAGRQAIERALSRPEIHRLPFAHWTLLLLGAQILSRSGDLHAARDELARIEEAVGDYGIRWMRELVAQETAFVASRLGDRKTAGHWFEAAVSRAPAGASEAVVRAVWAVEQVRWGALDDALRNARRSVELALQGDGRLIGLAPWWSCFALWALGRGGAAKEAWSLARRHRKSFQQPGLRLAQHAIHLALADLALRAGDEGEALARAREALAVARREGLTEPDPWVGALAGPEVAALALRAGVDDAAACDLLASTAPDQTAPLLAELATSADTQTRARGVQLLARLGGRESFEPLRRASRDRVARVRDAACQALATLDLRPRFALAVRSFGGLEVRRGSELVGPDAWKGQTARRLFARLLVAEGRPVTRQQLQNDLWPGTEEASSRNNLRVATARLHEALDPERPPGAPPHFVLVDEASLALHATLVESWDATRFRRHLQSAQEAERAGRDGAALDAFRDALALYRGPLLEGLEAEWIEPLRQELARRFAAAAQRAGPRLLRRGRLDEALDLAERLLRADPADEHAFALRMRAQLARHDRAGALRSYEEGVAALRRELDLEPGEDLRRLAAQARGQA